MMLAGTMISQTVNFRGGLNLSNAQVVLGDDVETDNLTSFQVGILAEMGEGPIGLETGLLYSGKGFKTDQSVFFGSIEADQTYRMNYLEIPVNAKFSFGGENVNFYVAAGPYLGLALNGTATYQTEVGGVISEETEDLEFGSDENEDDLKRWDYGLNVGAGIQVDRFHLGATYGYGLANLLIDPNEDDKLNNRVLQIHLGVSLINN